jgi:hypothetical protein
VLAQRFKETAVDMAAATHTLNAFLGPEPAPPPATTGGDVPRSAPVPANP